MNAKQTSTFVGRLVEHQDFFRPLPTADAQWGIKNPKDAATLMIAALRNRPKPEGEANGNGRAMSVLRPVVAKQKPAEPAPFKADDTFFNKKNKSGVKLVEPGVNFTAWFSGKAQEDGTPNALTPYTLTKRAYDNEIITDLSGEEAAESSLADIWALMEAQPTGKEGQLLTNGWANIFYVRDKDNVLRAVRVYWYGDGWGVSAYALDDGCWNDGGQAFSRNS